MEVFLNLNFILLALPDNKIDTAEKGYIYSQGYKFFSFFHSFIGCSSSEYNINL